MSLSGEAVLYATSPSDKVAQETARRERRRRKVVKELFDTERTYLRHLELVNKFFDFPLRFACLVPDDVHARLFSNLEQIREVNVTLLETLEQTTVGQAFSQLAPFLKLYSTYANNHQYALNTLQEWQAKSPDFTAFIARQEDRPEVMGLKLNALLITPVQRIPRYKMLLEELLKNTPNEHHDYISLSEAAEKIAEIASHINEHIRQNENFMKMLAIQRSFDSSAPKLLAPGRQFIKEGPLKKVSRKGGKSYERMFFLFSDILLYGKPKFLDGGGKLYTCSCVLPLRHCKVEPVFITSFSKSDTGGVFRLTCKEESLVLYSEDRKNAKDWSEEVDKAIRKICDDRQTLRKPSSNKIPLRGRSLRRHRKEQKKTDIKIPGKTPMRPLSLISNNSGEDSDGSPCVRARLDPVRQHFKILRNSSLSNCENGSDWSTVDSPVLRKKSRPNQSDTSADMGVSLSETSESVDGSVSYRDSQFSSSSQESSSNSIPDVAPPDGEGGVRQSLRQYSFSLRGSRGRIQENNLTRQVIQEEMVLDTGERKTSRSPVKKSDRMRENSADKSLKQTTKTRSMNVSSTSLASVASSVASSAWFPPNSPANKHQQRKTLNMRLRSYLQKPLRRWLERSPMEPDQHLEPEIQPIVSILSAEDIDVSEQVSAHEPISPAPPKSSADLGSVEMQTNEDAAVEEEKTMTVATDPRVMRITMVVPEMKEIIDSDIVNIDQTPPLLSPFPDVDENYRQSMQKVQDRFTIEVVRYEIRKLFEIITLARNNEQELKKKLTKRDQELQDMAFKLHRDPRIAKVMTLADRWRHERDAAEEVGNEYLAEINGIKADLAVMESNLNNLKKSCRKIQDELAKKKGLEMTLEKLEENNMLKDQQIQIITDELLQTQHNLTFTVNEAAKVKEDLLGKIAIGCERTQPVFDVFKKELAELREEKTNLKIELFQKNQTIMSLGCMVKTVKFNMLGIKKCLISFQSKCKILEDKMRVMASTIFKSKVENEKYQLLLHRLGILMKRKNMFIKVQEEEATKLKEQVSTYKKQTELKEAKLFKQETALKFLTTDVGRLRSHLRAVEASEGLMVKCHEADTRTIQTMKNKRNLDEAKINDTTHKLIHQKSLLAEAIANAEGLFKNLTACVKELKQVYRSLEVSEDAVAERTNIIRHLDNLCRSYAKTIYVQDSENESLVVNSKKLEHLLKKSKENMLALRQKNADAATDAHLQAELFQMIKYMLTFTQKEKETITKMYERTENNIILLKQQDAKRMHDIMKLSEEVYAQKITMKNFIRALEHEKKESGYLLHQLHNADAEHKNMRFINDKLRHERDKFGATVIKCNTEVELLQHRMDIMNRMLKAGYREVFSQHQDMRILKLEIRNLRRQVKALKNTHSINSELRSELIEANRNLQLEQDKRAAIERMKNTMPHPNRYLKQAHVSEYEKVLKIQMLQKTLVGKITEGICKEKLIMSRERQLAQLKLLLAKRPSVDSPLEMDKARHLILKKSNQIKALLAELNVASSDLENSNMKNGKLLVDLKAAKEEIAMYKRRSINKGEAPADVKPTFQIHRPKMKRPGFAVTKNRLIKATLTPLYTSSHTL